MRAIKLTLESKIFTVTHEKIHVHSIMGIERDGNMILIKKDHFTKIKVNHDDTMGTNGSQKYYFELEDAQKEQIIGRNAFIDAKFDELQKVQSCYNELIKIWLNQPAHDPFEKEVKG